jgi:hypothetical protein
MINAAIAGIGWWGRKIVAAVQGKSERLRFIRGVSKEPDSVREFDAFADAVAGRGPYPIAGDEMIATIAAFEAVVDCVQSHSASVA